MYLISPDHDWFVVSGRPQWAEADLSYNDESVLGGHGGDQEAVVSRGFIE